MEQEGKKIVGIKKWQLAALIAVLAVSNLFLGFLYCSKKSNANQEKFQESYPLLDPCRGDHDPRDLIVNVQPLRDELNEIGQDPSISIYFEYLSTGANIAVNKDLKIWPASLMKIPIAMAAMKKVEKGEWDMKKDFVLEERDKNNIFGNLFKRPAGTHLKLEEILDELLINSDNTARNILARSLSMENFGEVVDHLGVEFDYQNEDQITAKKYSIFWRSLFTSSYLSPEYSEKLIEIMTRSAADKFLAGSLPPDVKFGHKIGVRYDEVTFADSGIVYIPNRPYILTVMIKNHPQAEAERIMQEISRKAYEYVSRY